MIFDDFEERWESMRIEEEFHHAMIGVADFANKHRFGYRFRQMIERHGGVDAAKRLLASREIQTGLLRLYDLKALEKSMEALVLQDRFKSLLSEEEIQEAHRRLEELRYFEEK